MNRKRGRKHSKNGRVRPRTPRKNHSPTTADEFFALPESIQELYLLDLELVSLVRGGISQTKAMKQLKLTRAQVDRFARGAFRKLKNGRYTTKAYDRLLRVVMVTTEDGLREVATLDSRQASKAGKHSDAVNRYLQTGDASRLAQFEGKYITDAKGEKVPLLTDLEELDKLGSAGLLSFETIYARTL